MDKQIRNSTAEFLIFTSQNKEDSIEVKVFDETVWLTQNMIAQLFDKGRTTITEHLKNIFESEELDEKSVCREFRHTANDGKTYNTKYYNLDAIISVGYRVNMAYLPINVKLLKNVVNDVAGFYLEDRFFFTPGFPSMSQSMVLEALDRHYTKSNIKKYRKTVTIVSSENDLIEVMKKIPTHLEFSSLPKIIGEERRVVISVAGYNQDEVNFAFKLFLDFCLENKKEYVLEDINEIR